MVFMDLDAELDVLPGETASVLRLERFSTWYMDGLISESKYKQELERILKVRSRRFVHFNEPAHIQNRYRSMRSSNPRSLVRQYYYLNWCGREKGTFGA